MNGITIMLIAIAVLGGGYLLYGRWLAKLWGVDPKAKTPAYEMEDGVDYTPAEPGVVFGHQFASIAGAGPINGPIQAAIFGWVPVLLWVLVGGLFFGAVQDFVAMFASVRNKGRTIGYIIELCGCSRSLWWLRLRMWWPTPSMALQLRRSCPWPTVRWRRPPCCLSQRRWVWA